MEELASLCTMALSQSPCCGDAGYLCYTLFMWHCNSGRFLPYRQEFCGDWCSTHRLAFPLASSGLLHLLYGWLCLQATGSMIHELSSIPVGNNWG